MGIEVGGPWPTEWRWPNWETESYPEAKDLMMIPAFSVFFFTIRYVLDTFVFEVTCPNLSSLFMLSQSLEYGEADE